MQSVASSLRTVSIPLAIAGGAAVKMAADFDKSMTQIKSLVGVAGDEVDAMGERVKVMASETGTNASEAAQALFFITSAGLRGAEAMDVLEASMRAAAVGLGETKTVADLATSAMNAYGSDVLSAADATDVMVSAVREGKLEASELAGSMGRVLPVASAMGVRFDEVGAAFAALSRTGTNAAEAATQIRGILTSLLKPTTDAQEALAEMGLSTQGLRQEIKEKGLLAALETLKTNFDGNDEAAQRVFGNVRALSGIMDLLGANVDTTRAIFDSMTDSAGATNKAFETLQDSAEYKLRKSIIEVKNSFMETGQVILESLLPHLQSLADSLKSLFEDFRSLDEDTQKAIITLGEILVIAPLVVGAIGTITKAVAGLSEAITVLAGLNLSRVLGPALAFLSLRGDESADLYSEVMLQANLAVAAEDRYTESLAGQEEQANKTAAALDKLIKGDLGTRPTTTTSAAAVSTTKPAKGISVLSDDFLDLEHAIYKADEAAKGLDLMTRFDFAEQAASVEYFGNVVANTGNTIIEPINKIAEAVEESTAQVSNLTLMIGRDLASAFGAFLDGENFMKSMINTLKDLAKQLLATAAAAAVLALLTGGNFGAIFQGLSGINLNTRGAAGGGRIQSPSPSGIGNIPASMMPNSGVNLTGQFRLDGQDLVVAVERANKQRGNFI
jgi:TP901 family phage tail tape measure protein